MAAAVQVHASDYDKIPTLGKINIEAEENLESASISYDTLVKTRS